MDKILDKFQIGSWTLLRKLQMGVGLFALGNYFWDGTDLAVLLFGLILVAQAVFNLQLGCASGQCQVPKTKNHE